MSSILPQVWASLLLPSLSLARGSAEIILPPVRPRIPYIFPDKTHTAHCHMQCFTTYPQLTVHHSHTDTDREVSELSSVRVMSDGPGVTTGPPSTPLHDKLCCTKCFFAVLRKTTSTLKKWPSHSLAHGSPPPSRCNADQHRPSSTCRRVPALRVWSRSSR